MAEQLNPAEEGLQDILGNEPLVVLAQRAVTKSIGGTSRLRYREAGMRYHIGTVSAGVRASVIAEQMNSRYTERPRTIFRAQAVGSEVVSIQEVSPPVTDPLELERRTLRLAAGALVNLVLIDLSEVLQPPVLPE